MNVGFYWSANIGVVVNKSQLENVAYESFLLSQ